MYNKGKCGKQDYRKKNNLCHFNKILCLNKFGLGYLKTQLSFKGPFANKVEKFLPS